MKIRLGQLRKIIREALLLEVGRSVPTDEMMEKIKAGLPKELKSRFPNWSTMRGGVELQRYDLIKTLGKFPEVFSVDGDSINFGVFLGSSLERDKETGKYSSHILSPEYVEKVKAFISDFVGESGWYVWSFDAQAQSEILTVELMSEEMEEVDPEDALYHLTDAGNVKSILENGLTPKTSKQAEKGVRLYSPRIYLFADKQTLEDQIKQNAEAHEEKRKGGYSWNPTLTATPDAVVLVINKNKLPPGIKFERDPEFGGSKGAVYTRSFIPPEAITRE